MLVVEYILAQAGCFVNMGCQGSRLLGIREIEKYGYAFGGKIVGKSGGFSMLGVLNFYYGFY